MLIEMPSGEERLEPILDVSPTRVLVLVHTSPSLLAPGTVLPRLRFFVGGECTLQSRGTVRESMPVSLGENMAVKVGIELEAREAGRQPLYHEYSQPAIIADALGNLIAAEAQATIEGSRDALTFRRMSAGKSLALSVNGGAHPALRRGHAYTLSAELYGTRLALSALYH
ncbi:MAG: hypothetical protein HYZ27_06610, partial [Deltaproteobacteria bacterium]|nr:hypothetical protein [Deltaproteobacteria bacterium]